MTDRSVTIAATPSERQAKKNSSRFHDARVSRTAMRRTNIMAPAAAASARVLRVAAAVAQRQLRFGQRRQRRVVRHQHQGRLARMIDGQQQIHDVPAVGAVEIAGRLVGEQDRRIVGQRAGNRDPLLLAAGELRRIVMPAAGQAHLVEQRVRAAAGVAAPGNLHRHQDVLARRQRRHQVEELEDEADLLAAQPRESILVERGDVHAVDQNRAGGRRVEAGDQARAAWTCRCPRAR